MSMTADMPDAIGANLANRRTARDYRVATRHSTMVAMLKRLLPAAAIAVAFAFGTVVALTYVPIAGFSIGGAALRDGKLVMEDPRMAGFDSQQRPYDVRAGRAVQDLSTPDLVTLEKIDANVPIDATGFANLKAKSGVYNTALETLQLRGDISVTGARGLDIRMDAADVNMKDGSMTSETPVTVSSDRASISADTVTVQDSGKRIIFKNRVVTTITQPVERGQAREPNRSR